MTKLVPSPALVKRGTRLRERVQRHGGNRTDRQVIFECYTSSLRDAANRSRSSADRAFSRELAAAFDTLLRQTRPLFDKRLKAQQKRRAPVVTQPIIWRAAPRARRGARRSLAARAGVTAMAVATATLR